MERRGGVLAPSGYNFEVWRYDLLDEILGRDKRGMCGQAHELTTRVSIS